MILATKVWKLGKIWDRRATQAIVTEEQKRALTEIGVFGEAQFQKAAHPFTNTGHLEGSMTFKVTGTTVRIGTPVAYGVVVLETGRRPGTLPPIQPLKLWVLRKLRPQDTARGRQVIAAARRAVGSGKATKKLAAEVSRDALVTRIAWAVAIAIKRRGLPTRLLASGQVFRRVMLRAHTIVSDAAMRVTKRIGP